MYCRNCGNVMDDHAAFCTKCGVPKGTGAMYCPSCGAQTNPNAVVCVNCGVALNRNYNIYNSQQKSKIAAGVLGIFLGGLGIHNFYLGFTTKAVIQLLVCIVGGIITCGLASVAAEIWGFVEGILILTGSINQDAQGVPLRD